jgi:broad-specificity NMP kinase
MTQATAKPWEDKRTDESRRVEDVLRKAGFAEVDAYRYNSASIRVRVIDPRFDGLSAEARDAMVEPHLATLPERTQADIITLLTFAPSELDERSKTLRARLLNLEFVEWSPSEL